MKKQLSREFKALQIWDGCLFLSQIWHDHLWKHKLVYWCPQMICQASYVYNFPLKKQWMRNNLTLVTQNLNCIFIPTLHWYITALWYPLQRAVNPNITSLVVPIWCKYYCLMSSTIIHLFYFLWWEIFLNVMRALLVWRNWNFIHTNIAITTGIYIHLYGIIVENYQISLATILGELTAYILEPVYFQHIEKYQLHIYFYFIFLSKTKKNILIEEKIQEKEEIQEKEKKPKEGWEVLPTK